MNIEDDQLLVETILRYRPQSNPLPIKWEKIESDLELKLSLMDRRDLRHALEMLAARIPGQEWERKNGPKVDKELDRLAKGTRKLAEQFDAASADVAYLMRLALGEPALALLNVATTLEALVPEAGRRGRKRMVGEEVFALTVQRVWKGASGETTRGATYTSYEEEEKGVVAGPAVQLATALLKAADLLDHLPRVREALRRPLRTRGLNPSVNAEKQRRIQRKVDKFFEPAEISFLITPEDDEAAEPSSETGPD